VTETELEDRLRTAEPIVQRIVQSRLRQPALQQDRGDVCSDACVDLLRRLRESPEIQDFEAYAATVAHHACDRYYRGRSPLRHRLKNRLRYLTANDARFAVWTSAEQRLVCGLAAWRGGAPVSPQPVASSGSQLDAVATGAFRACGGPLLLDDLVDIAAQLLGIRDGETAIDSIPLAVPQSRSPEQKIDQRRWFAKLWQEILLLPPAQRIALLLHLRDERGGPALPYFPASGAASLRQIAAAMETTGEELATIWPTLPWSDLAIAERLRVTRQQVINLRAAARQRLTRRCPPDGP